jgi:hypothetical protein
MPNQTLAKVDWREATRQQAKACIAIDGLPGEGKSGLALLIAHTLAGGDWKKVYGCDTENRSLDLFQGIATSTGEVFDKFRKFDLLPIHGYAPTNYLAIKESAKKNGALAFINDSATHMWTGPGGILSLVSDAKAKDGKMDNYRVWGLPEIKREKDSIVDCIRDSDVHMISTIRVKEKYEMGMEDGKSKLKSLGEQQIMMPDLKYEPDLVLSMVSPGTITGQPPVAIVTKSRYAIFVKGETYQFTQPLLDQLRAYLAEGADPEELKEQQRMELVVMITKLLDSDASKKTTLPYLKENLGCKDTPLKDLALPILKQLYTLIIS